MELRRNVTPQKNAAKGFGMLNADVLSRANSSSLGRGVFLLCILQVLVAICVLWACYTFLYDFSSATGMIIGVLLCAVSCIGLIGSSIRNRSLLNVYLIGTLLVMILCFHFVSEVQREVNVDCSMAELDIRLEHLEEVADRNAQSQMFTSLVSRLDEMDEMLDMVEAKTKAIAEAGSDAAAEAAARAASEQQRKATELRMNDYSFLKNKLLTLKEHAVKVIESSEKFDDMSNEVMSQEERDRLENRLEAAEEVFRRVEQLEQTDMRGEGDDPQFSVDEYKALLKALTSATVEVNNLHKKKKTGLETNVDAKTMYKEMADVRNVKRVLDRHLDNEYGDDENEDADFDGTMAAASGYETPEMKKRKQQLQAKRDSFRKNFEKQLVDNYYGEGGKELDIDDLPEHCLMETSARNILGYCAVALLGLQLASAYLVLSLLFRIPVKVD